jgi:hypothetical protein
VLCRALWIYAATYSAGLSWIYAGVLRTVVGSLGSTLLRAGLGSLDLRAVLGSLDLRAVLGSLDLRCYVWAGFSGSSCCVGLSGSTLLRALLGFLGMRCFIKGK